MNRLTMVALSTLTAILMSGCDPDKFSVTVPVSAIKKAADGKVGYAKAKAYYRTTQDDVKRRLPQIRDVIKKHLGDQARVDISTPSEGNATLTAAWKIPVFAKGQEGIGNAPVLGLMLDGTWLSLTPQTGLNALNSDLGKIDATISAGFMCDMDIVVKNDTEEVYTFLTCGTFVDEQPYVHKDVKVDADESATVSFKRKDEGSVYHFKDPCIGIYKK